jgi:hypothetical protein
VPTKVQAMDFSETDLTAKYQALAQKIEDIDVGVLGEPPSKLTFNNQTDI